MKALLTAIAMALVAWPAGDAAADIFTCVGKDGRTWVTNRKVKGARCRLGFKTPKAKPPAAETGKPDRAAAAAKRPTKRYVPRKPGVGGAADEPASRQAREDLYAPYVEEAATLYDLPAPFIRAVIRVESNFKYRALSGAGAQGLMQLMPVTARQMGVSDPFDPRDNILGGARLIRVLANRFDGDIIKVLSAYYAGSGAVTRKGGIPTEDTEGYVRAVLDRYYQYRALEP